MENTNSHFLFSKLLKSSEVHEDRQIGEKEMFRKQNRIIYKRWRKIKTCCCVFQGGLLKDGNYSDAGLCHWSLVSNRNLLSVTEFGSAKVFLSVILHKLLAAG